MRADAEQAAAPDDHTGAWLDSLKGERQLAKLTVEHYGRDLRELAQLAREAGVALPALTHFHIRKFAAQLHARGANARSIARKLSAWRGYFRWLSERNLVAANPVDGIKAPKRDKPLPKALAADDAVRLVSEKRPGAAVDDLTQACNRAMFELLYSSGLRVSELIGLDVRYAQDSRHTSNGWVDFDAHEVHVVGKGSKARSVPVGEHAIAALQAWLAVRGNVPHADPHALFLSQRGARMSARVVQMRLKAHARALGLPVDVHPHVLRHSFASHVLQSSGDLRAVQEMLGHASISATQIYTSLDFQRLSQVYDAAHPRAKKKPASR
ncbi:MAG TPA: tyrosine recombinase XerC [Oxalicibacterium sp.]|nr:tyrosine recombinase XerC [Oxalicibacterium sp.]